MKNAFRAGVAVMMGLASCLATSQSPNFTLPGHSVNKTEAVTFLYPEQVRVPAGKSSEVVLHFRVAQGLHINSHTPPDEFLIGTELTIPVGSGVRLDTAQYPPGKDFTPDGDPDLKLNVYTGEFTIRAHIVATQGNHLVEAGLRFQACDQNACMPPKTITVPIDVIGK